MNEKKSISPNCLTDDEIALVLLESAEAPLLEKATNHLNQCVECFLSIQSLINYLDEQKRLFENINAWGYSSYGQPFQYIEYPIG